jgi:NAD(P)-dependent dehydrogenase (short-subunit alcohol dehydrogenase family)
LALAERGARVVVNDVGAALDGSGSSSAPADAVVAEIRRAGGEAVAEYSSVATIEGGEAIIGQALNEYGRIDALVNNAGNIEISSFAKLDIARIHKVLDVHLGGAFNVTQPAYRAMIAQKTGGRIVFTLSGVSAFGNFGASTYGAAKGGIAGLQSVLKLEAERHGIRVNGVAPMAQTRMAAGVVLSEYEQVSERSMRPDLVAPVVVYLCSAQCAVTGDVWSVGSGAIARLVAARTKGVFKNPDKEGAWTPEEIVERLTEIRDPASAVVLGSWLEEWEIVVGNFNSVEPITQRQSTVR